MHYLHDAPQDRIHKPMSSLPSVQSCLQYILTCYGGADTQPLHLLTLPTRPTMVENGSPGNATIMVGDNQSPDRVCLGEPAAVHALSFSSPPSTSVHPGRECSWSAQGVTVFRLSLYLLAPPLELLGCVQTQPCGCPQHPSSGGHGLTVAPPSVFPNWAAKKTMAANCTSAVTQAGRRPWTTGTRRHFPQRGAQRRSLRCL